MRAVVYCRTSTEEQSTENQREELVRLVEGRRWTLMGSVAEQVSSQRRRPGLEELVELARRGGFDVLVIWSIDRLGRSMAGNLKLLVELAQLGVTVVSLREPWLEQPGPTRELLVAIFSWVAEQERAQIVARTKAALARARKEGRVGGRPRRVDAVQLERGLELRARGKSLRHIAQALKIPKATIALALSRKPPPGIGPGTAP